MLDTIHHIAINVADLEKAIRWYQTSFSCEVVYRGRTEAVLEFANIRLALVMPSQEPGHLAFLREDAQTLGELRLRPDGVMSTFIADPTGNVIEIVKKT